MTEADETTTVKKVAERLSFFFSNANLRMDRFMKRETEQNDGFVKIEVLLKFNTIKIISEDPKLIAKAVKEVKNPPLKLNDDESAIARVDPFTSAMMEDNVKVTLRISNIPTTDGEKGPEYKVTREEVAALFGEYGDVAMVRLLQSKVNGSRERVAVGHGFVEFHTTEDMEKAVAELCVENIEDENLKPVKKLEIKGEKLNVKTMQQWLDKKQKQKDAKLAAGNEKRFQAIEKKKRKAEEKEQVKKEIEEIEFKMEWKPNCVIQMKGLNADECDRESILAAVKGFINDDAIVVRADYSRGLTDGAIRFDEPNERIASLANALKEGEVKINDIKVESAILLEGEEEKKYYDDYIAFRTKLMRERAEAKQQRKKQKGGRGGRW